MIDGVARHQLAAVIQLAVAPVFLLAGVGATLNVLATASAASSIGPARWRSSCRCEPERGARVARKRLTRVFAARHAHQPRHRPVRAVRPAGVARGRRLFVGSSLRIDLSDPIAVAFVVALLSLAAALVCFLREVFIATASLTFGGVGRHSTVARRLSTSAASPKK